MRDCERSAIPPVPPILPVLPVLPNRSPCSTSKRCMRDLRYAVRTLARTPAFTATVVLTIALGVGANTAVFSVVNAVLLAPLRFPQGDRLMLLRQTRERSGETNIAPIRLEDWNRLNATFDAITGYYMEDASETSGDLPERIRRGAVALLDGGDERGDRRFHERPHPARQPRTPLSSGRRRPRIPPTARRPKRSVSC